jgi:hypothetical protein
MKDHCPMKARQGFSMDKGSHSSCECFAEKRENTPNKISDNGSVSENAAVAYSGVLSPEFLSRRENARAFFIDPLFTGAPSLNQSSARAPPCL